MEIVDLGTQPDLVVEQAAALLVHGFDEPRGWPAVTRFSSTGKLGYVVTGVMPDANGRGRPDIYMSKRLETSSDEPGERR